MNQPASGNQPKPLQFRIIMAVVIVSSIGFLMMVNQIDLPDVAGIPLIWVITFFELLTVAAVGFILHRSMVGGKS